MSIYIARDDATLGPYSLEDAAKLVRSGFLSADDLAARNGDAAWVPLSMMLARTNARVATAEMAPPRTGPGRRQAVGLIIFCSAVVLVVGAALFAHVRQPSARVVPLVETPATTSKRALATATPLPTVERSATPPRVVSTSSPSLPRTGETPGQDSAPAAVNPRVAPVPSPVSVVEASPPVIPVSPPALRDCRFSGTVSLQGSGGGEPTRFADVRVAAYSLDDLEPSLGQRDARVRSALNQLEPQLQAAADEKARRAAAADGALQTALQSPANDPLHSSLVFAARQARADLETATVDYQYVLDQRTEIMDGEDYYRKLPVPVAESRTDAAGEYHLELPTGGRYAVAARVSQTGITGTHMHYWLVRLDLPDGSSRSLQLFGGNMSSSGSGQSLLHTAN